MIKVDKGLVNIQGDIASITAEGVVMLRAMHSLVVERFGKKLEMLYISRCLKWQNPKTLKQMKIQMRRIRYGKET